MSTDKGCGKCKHAEFERTPTGRIKKKIAGHCQAPIPDVKLMLPVCALHYVRIIKDAIWSDWFHDCVTFSQVEKSPNAAGKRLAEGKSV